MPRPAPIQHLLIARQWLLLIVAAASACAPPATIVPTPSPVILTPPPPSTPTTSPSPLPPTATPTPEPAPRSFTEEFEGSFPHWTFLLAGAGSGELQAQSQAGSLRLMLSRPHEWAYGIYSPQSYSDVRVQAQVDFGAGGQGSAGLICRYDRTAGWYEFNIHADQTYALLFGQRLADGVARYVPLVVEQSGAIAPAANQIELVCEGDVLTPYINGVQIRRRQEKLHVLQQGQAGVSAASLESAPLEVSFDWISVGDP